MLNFILQLHELYLGGRFLGIDHDIHRRRELLEMLAHRTPHAALNTIALNRSTQSAPNRQTNSYANALGAGIAGRGIPPRES